jgi:DNA-binding MarR family transcriptional regulator
MGPQTAPDILPVWINTVVNYPSDIELLELGQNYTNERMAWHELILRDPHLKPSEKVIAGLIMHMINREQGYAYPTIETLAEETGLSRSTVKRVLDQLRNLGWIWTEEVGRNRSLHYHLTYSRNRRTIIEEAKLARRNERKVRREKRDPRSVFGSPVGPPVTLLKAHERTFGRVLDDPTGRVISEPQTQLPIPDNETRPMSNSFGRAAGYPVIDGAADANVIKAGLPEADVIYHLDRCLEGWRQVPMEMRHAAIFQVVAQGLTREQAGQMAEALGCQLRGRSF